MGLESLKINALLEFTEFAPCMGLERIYIILYIIRVKFAPCMGLERIKKSRRL